MKKKSYNNIHTIIKNKIFLKKIYNEKNTKKKKKNLILMQLRVELREKKIHKAC